MKLLTKGSLNLQKKHYSAQKSEHEIIFNYKKQIIRNDSLFQSNNFFSLCQFIQNRWFCSSHFIIRVLEYQFLLNILKKYFYKLIVDFKSKFCDKKGIHKKISFPTDLPLDKWCKCVCVCVCAQEFVRVRNLLITITAHRQTHIIYANVL